MRSKIKLAGLLFVILALCGAGCESSTETESAHASQSSIYSSYPSYSHDDYNEPAKDEEEEEDEENRIEDGSHEVEACRNGSCYTLDADVEDGVVTRINFPNGGYRDIDAELDTDGSGSGSDNEGNDWEVTVDE